MIEFIIWYLIGFISFIIGVKTVEKNNILVKDIFTWLATSLLGPLVTVILIIFLIDKYTDISWDKIKNKKIL